MIVESKLNEDVRNEVLWNMIGDVMIGVILFGWLFVIISDMIASFN